MFERELKKDIKNLKVNMNMLGVLAGSFAATSCNLFHLDQPVYMLGTLGACVACFSKAEQKSKEIGELLEETTLEKKDKMFLKIKHNSSNYIGLGLTEISYLLGNMYFNPETCTKSTPAFLCANGAILATGLLASQVIRHKEAKIMKKIKIKE